MKKIVFTLFTMCFLMSFTTYSKEELPSPECFDYADGLVAWKKDCVGFDSDLDEYNYWVRAYDDCEKVTNHDEFEYVPN